MIDKTVIKAGKEESEPVDFKDGCKVVFHFKTTRRSDDKKSDNDIDQIPIDDTRTMSRPMELIIGKQFKLDVWEQCLRTMQIGELARFVVDKSLVTSYPMVSKMIRSAFGDKSKKTTANDDAHMNNHCCGMMAMTGHKGPALNSLGHADLDELQKNPGDLVFTFELLQVIEPGDYEKDSWAMDNDEKLASIPRLKEDGNRLYKGGKVTEAGVKYAEALGRLETLMLREKPGDVEWTALDSMKLPLLLNYSQCKLLDGDFYAVIEHTSEALKKDPDNVKALFRRAQAHMGAWNPTEARHDYERACSLDRSLQTIIDKELARLDEEIRRKNQEDKSKLMGKMF